MSARPGVSTAVPEPSLPDPSSALGAVLLPIENVATRMNRPAARLLAVSKTRSTGEVAALADAGQQAFGENYVQEGADKVEALRAMRLEELGADERGPAAPGLEWHFIGPLQSNKTRRVANTFDWVHSIDRLTIAERLADQRAAHLAPLKLCIQVNVSAEDSKSGVAPE